MRVAVTSLLVVAVLGASVSCADPAATPVTEALARVEKPAPTPSVTPTPQPTEVPVVPPPRPTAVPGFEPRKPARLVHSVKTKDKVVFITIDDGLVEDPKLQRYLEREGIPVTTFLTTGTVQNWSYWKDFSAVGSLQNHTVSHPALPSVGAAGQQYQICASNQEIEKRTGQIPWMTRPPYGEFNSDTLAAAGRCGLDWVVHWSVTFADDRLAYQVRKGALKKGDIILTHFREDLREDLPKAVAEIERQGFRIARLEDYLTPRGWHKRRDHSRPQEASASVDVLNAEASGPDAGPAVL